MTIQLSAYDRALIADLTAALKSYNKGRAQWITARQVMELTGWNREQLRQARVTNRIEYKKNPNGGYSYDLHSVPKISSHENKQQLLERQAV